MQPKEGISDNHGTGWSISGDGMNGRLPTFLGLGVQKGGTTTLQKLLEQHPEVFLPPAKELHYFSLHYSRGVDWYRQQFTLAGTKKRIGEITPYYLFHPAAPRRIHALLPQARLVVLLRDPVERALSQLFHSRRLGLEPLGLEEALEAEPQRLAHAEVVLEADDGCHFSHQENSYLSRSRYGEQLQRLETLFPKEQLLVLRSEDLFEDPVQIWSRLLEFLELEDWPLPPLEEPANAGDGESATVPPWLRLRLRRQLEPTYGWVAEHYGIHWP
jgi:hypothetical protein